MVWLRAMQIQNSKLNLIPLTPEIAVEAGILKRSEISVADAIIAASALSVGASVVTNDPQFSGMGVGVMGQAIGKTPQKNNNVKCIH